MAAVVKIPYFLATRHAKSVSFSARGNYTKILQRTSGRLAHDNALRRIFDKPAQGGLRDGAGRRSSACRRQGPWRERDRSSPVRSWPASDSGSADHPSAGCARRQSPQGSFQRQEHHLAREAPSPQTPPFAEHLVCHFYSRHSFLFRSSSCTQQASSTLARQLLYVFSCHDVLS